MRHVVSYPMICFLVFLWGILCPSVSAWADKSPVQFRRYSSNNNLSQNTVLALTQDHNGKLWIGTAFGLNWYDGARVISFYKNKEDKSSLGNNYVYSLFTDKKGTVWAGTMVGLSRYNIVGNNFTNYFFDENQSVQVFAIKQHPEREQLLLGTNRGLVLFDKEKGKMVPVPQLKNKAVYSVCVMDDGAMLATSQGVYFYYYRNENVVQLLPELKNEMISCILYDTKRKEYWMGSFTSGVYRVNDELEIKQHYCRATHPSSFLSDAVRTIELDDKRELWIGTAEGLLILGPQDDHFTVCRFSHDDASSLGHNSVRSLWKDNQGGMWIGTFYGGFNYYHPQLPQFDVFQHLEGSNSLSDNIVSYIADDYTGAGLWVGTNDGGLNYYDKKSGRFTSYRKGTGSGGPLLSDNVKCVYQEEADKVYVGTHEGGLTCLHKSTGEAEQFSIPETASLRNSCYALLDGKDSTLWMGTMDGLYCFDKQDREVKLHPLSLKHPELKGVLVHALLRDTRQRIWIATEECLYLYSDGRLTVMSDMTSAAGPDNFIQALCIMEDSSHAIWVGTSNGFYRYREEPGKWDCYTMNDGLVNNYVCGIVEDARGRLWVSTNSGLSCFDVHHRLFHNYARQDGLPHHQFMPQSACKTKDGRVYLGTLGGMVCFHPDNFQSGVFVPAPSISGVSVLTRPLTQSVEDEHIKLFQEENGRLQGISYPSEYKLLRFNVTVVNFLSGSRNMFAYQLDGFDEDWTYANQPLVGSLIVTYPNLPPGRYLFKARASNDGGQWSDAVAECFVEVVPMWYQTWWFRTLLSLLVVVFLAFVVYFYFIRAKMRMRVRMEYLERMKIEELSQEKVRFYINMSHELRTPLSLILAPLEELMADKKSLPPFVRQKIGFVHHNGQKLLHIVNQLLAFRKAEVGALQLHVSEAPVVELVKNIFQLFKDGADKKNIRLVFHSKLSEKVLLPADSYYLETILMNLLSNAFKFTPSGGEIVLTLWWQDGIYGFSVRDTGIGIAPEQLSQIFERFYQVNDKQAGTGIGLSLVKVLVDRHHGTITVDSEVGKYTMFEVTLPADIQSFSPEERTLDEKHEVGQWELVDYANRFYVEQPEATEKDAEPEPDYHTGESSSSQKSTLLVVDDNSDVRDYLKQSFQADYHVLTADNGKTALDVLKEQQVDIVLSDVMMPEIDGVKLCETIKKNLQTCHIPVLLLSAKGSVEAQMVGIQGGADDYIPKPFSIQVLQGKVANILKQKLRLRYYYTHDIDIDTAKMSSNVMDEAFMKNAIQAVEENIANEAFSADMLGEALCMSRSSLYMKMNSICGESPANFIRRIRFNRACKLLLENRYSVAEISVMVGFSSPSYFSTSFKRYMGCLPSDYYAKEMERRK